MECSISIVYFYSKYYLGNGIYLISNIDVSQWICPVYWVHNSICTYTNKDVVDFAVRVKHALELKINKFDIMQSHIIIYRMICIWLETSFIMDSIHNAGFNSSPYTWWCWMILLLFMIYIRVAYQRLWLSYGWKT